jgi:hypothetical protein
VDEAAIALRGAASGGRAEVESGFALLRESAAGFATGLGFSVELLGDRDGSAHFAQAQDFDFEIAAFGFDGELVADVHFARGAEGLVVGFDTAQLAGLCSEGARFEEARRPQPFVETRAVHGFHASGREAGSGEAVSGEAVSDGTVSDVAVSGEAVSDVAISDVAISGLAEPGLFTNS